MTVHRYVEKLAHALLLAGETPDFIQAILEGKSKQSCLLWIRERQPHSLKVKRHSHLYHDFLDLLDDSQSPGSDPLFEVGAYYVLDLSSVLAASILNGFSKPKSLLDVCSAPGGKAIMAWRLIKPEFMVLNETINKRVPMLISNMKRCGVGPCGVLSKDPAVLSSLFPQNFDCVVVDAPCSGQSLIARGQKAQGCFHPRVIEQNARRQKRVLACAAQTVAPGGILAYMTCTYSLAENEEVIDWFLKKFPFFSPQEIPCLNFYHSHLTPKPMYRFWPHKEQQGAGGFTVLLQNQAEGSIKSCGYEPKFIWKNF